MTTRRADLLLLATTIIWGTTFAVVHTTAARFPPLAMIAARFTIATAVLLPLLIRAGVDRRLLRTGAILGILLFAGFALQTLGIARTTPARAGFITGLNVVFVPLFGRWLGDRISRRTLAAVGVSVVGLAILSWGCELPGFGCSTFESSLPERALGDRLVLLCAVVYAAHVVAVSRLSVGLPTLPLNAVQLGVVAVLAGAAAFTFERPIPTPSAATAATLVHLGLVCTVVTYSFMLAAQPRTTATRASLIYSLEAVFAALFSWFWVGEVPSAAVWVGGTLMLGAVVLMETERGREV